jgi:hypothetical protein
MAINATTRKTRNANRVYPRSLYGRRNRINNIQHLPLANVTDEQYAVWREYYCERILKLLK